MKLKPKLKAKAEPNTNATAAEVALQESTPLYDEFLVAMQDDTAGKEILDFLATVCFL